MKKTVTISILLSTMLSGALSHGAPDLMNPVGESDAAFEQRMAWFNEARFGMFIHWGAYSVLAGEWQGKPVRGYAEWIRGKANIPKADYREVCKQFQPDKFDADAWIRTARDAGMKYFVITTKHHDGFCLWDSAYTDYDIKDLAGLDLDPLADLSAACKKYGVRFGTYYSILDWEVPRNDNSRIAKPDDKDQYVQYMKNQIRELIEKYDTDILWFDGDWVPWWTLEDGADLYAYIRGLKPSILINNRVSKRKSFKRDFGTPENTTPGMDLGYDWEACWTINHSWGFKKADTKWTSSQQLVEKLSDIVSKGGNLLLNVGPKADGTFPEACTERLLEMGRWLDTAGEGIYGTDSARIPQPSWGRLTQKGQNLYLHVFNWPTDGNLLLPAVKLQVARAALLGAENPDLQVRNGDRGLEITLPRQKPEGLLPMIRLAFEGKIETFNNRKAPHDKQIALKEGDLLLSAKDAVITGTGDLRLEDHHLGFWRSNSNRATWEFENVSPDEVYAVELVYSLESSHAGAGFRLQCGGETLSGKPPATAGWKDYQTLSIGNLTLSEVGRAAITLQKQGGGTALFNLKAIVLRKQ